MLKAPNPMPAPCEPLSFDIAGKERVLQDIVDVVLAQSVCITCAPCLCRQELVEVWQSIHPAVTAALSCRKCEHVAAFVCVRLSYSSPYHICSCEPYLLQ